MRLVLILTILSGACSAPDHEYRGVKFFEQSTEYPYPYERLDSIVDLWVDSGGSLPSDVRVYFVDRADMPPGGEGVGYGVSWVGGVFGEIWLAPVQGFGVTAMYLPHELTHTEIGDGDHSDPVWETIKTLTGPARHAELGR